MFGVNFFWFDAVYYRMSMGSKGTGLTDPWVVIGTVSFLISRIHGYHGLSTLSVMSIT